MTRHPKSTGTIIEINFKLALCAAFGAAAYFSWPTHPQWWQAGILSIIMGCTSFAMLIDALRAMIKKREFDSAVKAYEKQADQPKSAELASNDVMENAGVFND